MAEPYLIVPLSVIDEINDLNAAFQTYNVLVEAWAQAALNGDTDGDPSTFTSGMQYLSRSIMAGYKRIEDEAKSFRQAGLRVEDGQVLAGSLEGAGG
jgi:hypothetical protein